MRPRPVPFLAVLALLLAVGWLAGRAWTDPPVSTSPDGRFHTCGVVTEVGVTEHLSVYRQRCGK